MDTCEREVHSAIKYADLIQFGKWKQIQRISD